MEYIKSHIGEETWSIALQSYGDDLYVMCKNNLMQMFYLYITKWDEVK